nr:auxin-responsive protein SAUR68-like [Ipomoea batatas]
MARILHAKQGLRRSSSRTNRESEVPKGHLAVYVGQSEKKRFVIPISYLAAPSFQELLSQAEEEFGFDHPMGGLTIPCPEETFLDIICSSKEVLQLSASSYRLGNEILFLRMAANFCHLLASLMSFLELIMVATWEIENGRDSKRLIKLAKRWQKFAAIRRKRISFPSLNDDTHSCSTSSAVSKGHFVVYTADQKRFVIPLSYLENEIIRQLLNMSEEEFGLPSDGPITLPCDAVFMEYIISLLHRGLSRELESALLVSVTSHRCSSAPLHQEGWRNQELLVC